MPDDMIITWDGDIGLTTVERGRADIDRVLDVDGAKRLIVDFSTVGVVEPVAVGLLVHALSRCTQQGITLLLRAVPPETKRLLALTGLTRLFVFDGPWRGPVAVENLPLRASLPAMPDADFDKVAELAAQLLGVPTALVTLVDQQQQVFPGAVGLPEPWQRRRSTPLSHSFCKYVVDRAAPLVVTDATTDPLVADNPAIADLKMRAYAGTPLTDPTGRAVGALCAIDSVPREWTSGELEVLRGLAAACSAAIHLRAQSHPGHGAAEE